MEITKNLLDSGRMNKPKYIYVHRENTFQEKTSASHFNHFQNRTKFEVKNTAHQDSFLQEKVSLIKIF